MINQRIERWAKIFHALGHPLRLLIVKGLLKNPCNVNKLVAKINVPQSTVSQHLSVLKATGIIKGERRGVQVCYRVLDNRVRAIVDHI